MIANLLFFLIIRHANHLKEKLKTAHERDLTVVLLCHSGPR
jgi:hypothetical protein